MHCIQALCCCIICAKNMILDLDISLWARAVSEKNARTCTSCTVAARSTCKAIPKDSQTLFQVSTLPTLTQKHPKGNSKKT